MSGGKDDLEVKKIRIVVDDVFSLLSAVVPFAEHAFLVVPAVLVWLVLVRFVVVVLDVHVWNVVLAVHVWTVVPFVRIVLQSGVILVDLGKSIAKHDYKQENLSSFVSLEDQSSWWWKSRTNQSCWGKM